MTLDERNKERQDTYTTILLMIQLGLSCPTTFEDVYIKFRDMMLKSPIGECTDEDETWLYKQLDKWNEYVAKENQEYEKKQEKLKKQKQKKK